VSHYIVKYIYSQLEHHYISPIQTIQTIDSNHSFLLLNHLVLLIQAEVFKTLFIQNLQFINPIIHFSLLFVVIVKIKVLVFDEIQLFFVNFDLVFELLG